MNPRVPGIVIEKQLLYKCCVKRSMLENPKKVFSGDFCICKCRCKFFLTSLNGCHDNEISGNR